MILLDVQKKNTNDIMLDRQHGESVKLLEMKKYFNLA